MTLKQLQAKVKDLYRLHTQLVTPNNWLGTNGDDLYIRTAMVTQRSQEPYTATYRQHKVVCP